MPASATAKFTWAETLIDHAATSPTKKVRKLLAQGEEGPQASWDDGDSAACAGALADAARLA